MTNTAESKNSTDLAIDECQEKIRIHRKQSQTILLGIVIFLTIIIALLSFSLSLGKYGLFDGGTVSLIISAFVIMIFGVFMSIYRFHLKEAAKYEHLHIGFLRIRVAGNNKMEGYKTEVRHALTENAFQFDNTGVGLSSNRRMKNPLPGHPTSDLSTTLINKLLDSVEFKKKE